MFKVFGCFGCLKRARENENELRMIVTINPENSIVGFSSFIRKNSAPTLMIIPYFLTS